MNRYTLVLEALKHLLIVTGKDHYSTIIDDCITAWHNQKDPNMLKREFEEKGRFSDFVLDSTTVNDPEKGLWLGQLMSALIAIAAQSALFLENNGDIDLDFLRRNFGVSNEVMNASRCSSCKSIEVTASDIDMYVSKIVIARVLIKGLETNDLITAVDSIAELTAKDIEKERRKAKIRLENSSIPFSDNYGTVDSCLRCGSKKITACKLLRSLRENIFIPLGQ